MNILVFLITNDTGEILRRASLAQDDTGGALGVTPRASVHMVDTINSQMV